MKTEEARFNVDGFAYDADTGGIRFGTRIVGSLTANGYIRVCRDGVRVMAHRLAWRLHFGVWPSTEIDHRDHNRSHNAICNLRQASRSNNAKNARSRSGRTGVRGVYFDAVNARWMVAVHADKTTFKGRASSFISAAVAAPLIRRTLHGDFTYQEKAA